VAIYHTVGRRGKVGYASGMRNKMSATSAREEAIARTWMLHVARSGGRIAYRIGAEKTDGGTEFKGVYAKQNATVEIFQTQGDPGRSECNALIEGEHRWLEVQAAVISDAGTANDDQVVAVAGEAYSRARFDLNHSVRGAAQKRLNRTAYELLGSKEEGYSAKVMRCEPKFLSLVYCNIKHKDRRGKTTTRAFRALYGSRDTTVTGAARVLPYNIHKNKVEILLTAHCSGSSRPVEPHLFSCVLRPW